MVIENITINDIDVFNNMKEEDYPDITVLNLGDNKITSIPEQISLLINLQKLYLFDNNYYTRINQFITQFTIFIFV